MNEVSLKVDGDRGGEGNRCLAIRRLPPRRARQELQHLNSLLLLRTTPLSRDMSTAKPRLRFRY